MEPERLFAGGGKEPNDELCVAPTCLSLITKTYVCDIKSILMLFSV